MSSVDTPGAQREANPSAIDLPQNAALLLVDVQQGLDDPKYGVRNNPDAEQVIQQLLEAWRAQRRPIFHIQHLSAEPDSPLRPELPGCEFKLEAQPLGGEPVLQKHVNSAFIGTGLEHSLRDQDIDTVVMVGLTTDHCVSTTARMAGNLGFRTIVVADATATFGASGYDGTFYDAEQVHKVALASLHNEFAQVVESQVIIDAICSKV